jgi:hypothetical protein
MRHRGRRHASPRSTPCVTEVDAKGKVVMVLKGLNSPNEARLLLNGNTLVAT